MFEYLETHLDVYLLSALPIIDVNVLPELFLLIADRLFEFISLCGWSLIKLRAVVVILRLPLRGTIGDFCILEALLFLPPPLLDRDLECTCSFR